MSLNERGESFPIIVSLPPIQFIVTIFHEAFYALSENRNRKFEKLILK